MDELFDAFELFVDLSDADLLSDDGILALAQLLEGADYIEIGPDFLQVLAVFDADQFDQLAESIDWLGFLGDFDVILIEEMDADWFDLSALFSNPALDVSEIAMGWDALGGVDPGLIVEQLTAAVGTVPPAFLQGLQSFDWNPMLNVSEPGLLGQWSFFGDSGGEVVGSISLFDHASEAVSTAFHEIGHHMAASFPQFFDQFSAVLSQSTDFLDSISGLLINYQPDEWAAEAFAEAISAYNVQPELLRFVAPEIFEVVDQWWMAASRA